MKLDKKLVTTFAVATFAIGGTALASFTTTWTSQSISLGGITATKTEVSTTSNTPVPVAPAVQVVPVATPVAVTVVADSPEAILAGVILRELGIEVSVTQITTYRGYNMGNGEIALAYNLAYASGRSVDDIVAMRFHQKMGWGKIAKVLGVKLNGAADRSVYILREANLPSDANNLFVSIKVDLDDEEREEKAKHIDKGDDAREHSDSHHKDKNKDEKNDHHKQKGNGKN